MAMKTELEEATQELSRRQQSIKDIHEKLQIQYIQLNEMYASESKKKKKTDQNSLVGNESLGEAMRQAICMRYINEMMHMPQHSVNNLFNIINKHLRE